MKGRNGNLKFDFSGKTVIVTGGTKGIGRDIALSFAEAGAAVGVCGRNESELKRITEEIQSTGGICEAFRADLSEAGDCLSMAEYFINRFSEIDILINNAGISYPEKLLNLNIEHWNRTLDVNLRAPAIISKKIAERMISRKSGVIINISSNAATAGIEEHAAYCSSKFGLTGLTKVMAVELGPYNIRVNAVAPTVVLTPMGEQVWGDPKKSDPVKARIPLGKFALPGDVTAAVMFVASDEASMLHGETILIDGGTNAKLY